MKKLVSAVVLFTIAACMAPAAAHAATRSLIRVYTATHNGPANGDDRAFGTAVDGSGNIIVAGYVLNGAGNNDFCTIKYSPDLVLLSSATYNSPANRDDRANGVAVDGSGNIIVTGQVDRGPNFDYFTIKYSPNLVVLATAAYNGPSDGYDYAKGVAVDGSGNVIVTGYGTNASFSYDYCTIKYDPGLTVLSSATYDGSANGDDFAYGVAVDGLNNVIVTGCSSNGSNDDYFTIKYSSGLTMLSSATYNGPVEGADQANGVAVDSSGNIIVTGLSENTSNDFFTIKYSPGLTVLSSATCDGAANGHDKGMGVAVDGSGNIIVAGIISNGSNDDYFTVKYDPGLSVVLASATFNSPANRADYARGVAVDASGSIFVTGAISDASGANWDLCTIKYNGPPSVASVTPSQGVPGTTMDVSISGKNFYAGALVSFGPGIAVNSASVASPASINANITVAADAAVGQRSVAVTNVDELSGVKAGAFSIQNPEPEPEPDPVVASTGTVIDPSTGGMATLQPESGSITVEVPGGTFEAAVTLNIATATVPASNQSTIKVTSVGVEITNSGGLQPSREITLTVHYRDADIAGLDENKLTLARYDSGRWIPIPTVVYASQNKLAGTVRHLSTFAVVQLAPAADLAGVKAYPNPFRPGNGALTLANLTGEASIRIFNVAGELVRTLGYTTADGRAAWDGRNDSGSTVASGIYFICIDSPQGKKRLKVAVEK